MKYYLIRERDKEEVVIEFNNKSEVEEYIKKKTEILETSIIIYGEIVNLKILPSLHWEDFEDE